MSDATKSQFETAASQTRGGLLRDLLGYLAETKKWWLLPVLIVMLLMGLLILLSGTAAGPLIYTLF